MTKFLLKSALVGLVALMGISGIAMAQNTATPKPQADLQVLRGKWVKVCGPEASGRMCMTTIDAFIEVKGVKKPLWLASAAVRDVAKTKTVLFRVPLQVRLDQGILMRIDGGKVSRVNFQFCQDIGCWVVLPANDKMINRLKKGKAIVLQFSDMRGKTHQVEITLAGFSKAFGGKPSKILAQQPAANVAAPAKASKKGDAPQ